MPATIRARLHVPAVAAALLAACAEDPAPAPEATAPPAGNPPPAEPALTVFSGATIIDGTGAAPYEGGLLVVANGRVDAIGTMATMTVPADAEHIDLQGAYIVPGFVNAHGHVGIADGLEEGAGVHTRANVLEQLALYARYGVTTVVSLGDAGIETLALRDAQQGDEALIRARIFTSGDVIDPATPAEAAADVAALAAAGVDWVKIRVDDGLGTREKMPPEVYGAVIDEARAHGLPVAAHVVYLEDAKGLARRGVNLIAHSVRDRPVDEDLIGLMREHDVCLSPTLTRELSVFVYAERPAFFDDPFFLEAADPAILETLQDPARQAAVRESRSAQYFREALPTAEQNLVALHEGGIRVAMGTDSGPPARFQGYFEHVEMQMMQDAGMQPEHVLLASTGQAADCMGLTDVGTLEPGRWADFVVLDENPLEDIAATRSIREVRIAGNVVPR